MSNIFTKTEQYLRRQQSIFGNTLFTEPFTESLTKPVIAPFTEPFVEPFIEPNAVQPTTMPTAPELFPSEATPAAVQAPQWRNAASLAELNAQICTCLNCKLGATRTKFVFGVGNPNADIMVIGEAPGADEDAQGEPFVGRAGQLLNKILEAIQFKREDVYIANIIKCRPPENRRPEPDEVEQCEPYLQKQIDLIKPRFILALGLTAVNTLLKANFKMGEIRGKQLTFHGIPMLATYHPAALLRNPEWKKAAWEDVQLLRRLYDESKAQ